MKVNELQGLKSTTSSDYKGSACSNMLEWRLLIVGSEVLRMSLFRLIKGVTQNGRFYFILLHS